MYSCTTIHYLTNTITQKYTIKKGIYEKIVTPYKKKLHDHKINITSVLFMDIKGSQVNKVGCKLKERPVPRWGVQSKCSMLCVCVFALRVS